MKPISVFAGLGIFLLSNACSPSTQITSSWRAPEKEIQIESLNKVLVVALLRNETSRRIAENEMIRYLRSKGVTSYNYLDAETSTGDERSIHNKLKRDHFDGAITMKLIDVDKEKTYVSGMPASFPSYYGNFSGYYYHSWPIYNTPGYYTTTKTYTIETNVFSIKEDRIIWSGITKTVAPDGVEKMIDEIAKVIYKQMLKEGFISK